MFEYQSAYKRNASGFHGKTFWYTVMTFILIFVAFFAAMLVMMLPVTFFDSAWGLLWILPMMFIIMLVAIFIMYPISIGILRFFASAYRQKNYKFKDVFITFRKGNYSKVIKLSLLMLVMYFIFSLIYGFAIQFLLMAINTPLVVIAESMSQGVSGVSGGEIALMVTLILLNILIAIISYIPYILIGIYMFLVFMAYIDQPLIPTFDKLKIGWNVMFSAGGSLIRLIMSNFLLLLLPTVLYVVMVGVIVALAILIPDEQSLGYLMIISIPIAIIIIMAVFCYAMYYMTGSLTAYYFKCRDELDRRYSEAQSETGRNSSYESFSEADVPVEKDGLNPY